MALPGPGNGPSEATAIEAYELRCQGMKYHEIATTLAGPPHRCGGTTTARRWAELGRALLAVKGDPLRKDRVLREMAVDALDSTRVEMDAAVKANQLNWEAMFRLRIAAIEKAARIGGYHAPPPSVLGKLAGKDKGGKRPRVDPGLLASLASFTPEELATLPREELAALLSSMLGSMLPDGRNQS